MQRIETLEELRFLVGEPAPIVVSKIVDRLNAATRRFIELSPFICLATSDADGRCDVSPRGDAPGFVQILDDQTLLVQERPGNRIADTLRNVIENPQIGVLFFLPGLGETFRVNGRASVVSAERLGIRIEIRECYTHCPKAFIRSQLWDPARFLSPSSIPSGGQVLRAIHGETFDGDTYDRERAARYARGEGLY